MIVTPFSLRALDFLVEQGFSQIKVSSGDLNDGPLLLAMAKYGVKIILSTGMATLGDIELALSVLAYGYTHQGNPSSDDLLLAYSSLDAKRKLQEQVTLLHCTSSYPTPFDQVNLNSMQTLKSAFGLNVGLSDHTQGFAISLASAALGASVIEKHFTLDKNQMGPDHLASIDVDELADLVKGVRQIEQALGSPNKSIQPCELSNRKIVRKSIVAAKQISKGESFNQDNLTCKRHGTGLSPMKYWQMLNQIAKKEYSAQEPIEL